MIGDQALIVETDDGELVEVHRVGHDGSAPGRIHVDLYDGPGDADAPRTLRLTPYGARRLAMMLDAEAL